MMITFVPPAFPLARWLLGLLAIAALLAGVGLRGYQLGRADGAAGAKAELAQVQAQIAADAAQWSEKVARANRRAIAAEAQASRRIAEITDKTRDRVTLAKEALHDAAPFASAIRPDVVDRLRLEQLSELAGAAATTAELSDSILHAVPVPSGDAGPPPGSDGAGRH